MTELVAFNCAYCIALLEQRTDHYVTDGQQYQASWALYSDRIVLGVDGNHTTTVSPKLGLPSPLVTNSTVKLILGTSSISTGKYTSHFNIVLYEFTNILATFHYKNSVSQKLLKNCLASA